MPPHRHTYRSNAHQQRRAALEACREAPGLERVSAAACTARRPAKAGARKLAVRAGEDTRGSEAPGLTWRLALTHRRPLDTRRMPVAIHRPHGAASCGAQGCVRDGAPCVARGTGGAEGPACHDDGSARKVLRTLRMLGSVPAAVQRTFCWPVPCSRSAAPALPKRRGPMAWSCASLLPSCSVLFLRAKASRGLALFSASRGLSRPRNFSKNNVG